MDVFDWRWTPNVRQLLRSPIGNAAYPPPVAMKRRVKIGNTLCSHTGSNLLKIAEGHLRQLLS